MSYDDFLRQQGCETQQEYELKDRIAALKAINYELLEALEGIADTLPGDEGLEIAMKYGFDAELVAVRAAIHKARNE